MFTLETKLQIVCKQIFFIIHGQTQLKIRHAYSNLYINSMRGLKIVSKRECRRGNEKINYIHCLYLFDTLFYRKYCNS